MNNATSSSPGHEPSAIDSNQEGTKAWSGIAVLWIAGIHTAFGVAAAARILPDSTMEALAGDSIPLLKLVPAFVERHGPNALILCVFWFLAMGIVLGQLGALLRYMERRGQVPPRFAGVQLGLLALLGGTFLPASGFWLALLPAWNILRQQH